MTPAERWWAEHLPKLIDAEGSLFALALPDDRRWGAWGLPSPPRLAFAYFNDHFWAGGLDHPGVWVVVGCREDDPTTPDALAASLEAITRSIASHIAESRQRRRSWHAKTMDTAPSAEAGTTPPSTTPSDPGTRPTDTGRTTPPPPSLPSGSPTGPPEADPRGLTRTITIPTAEVDAWWADAAARGLTLALGGPCCLRCGHALGAHRDADGFTIWRCRCRGGDCACWLAA